jgi:hypothetical protein
VELLEDRAVPATLTIADASIGEGQGLSVFVPANTAILEHGGGVAFGPDRTGDSLADLYVLGRTSNNIIVYDGQTGTFVKEYVPPG